MDLGLRGKVALVAAASRGLGRAIAEELASEGVSLVLCARGAERLEQARAEIAAQYHVDARAVEADLSNTAGIERVVAEAKGGFGRVDILVTNAGGPPAGAFESHQWDVWARTVDLTLRSAVELTRAVLPGMKQRRWGRILNVTSISVKQPVDNLVLSNSIRAAVTGMARTLASEVAPYGITVNNILPGWTRTERVDELVQANAAKEGITAEQYRDRIAGEIPMGRLGEPREFAALAAFLASDRASYITAQSIAVDGGWIRSAY